jgi:rRNA maturation endonuclease Nob1
MTGVTWYKRNCIYCFRMFNTMRENKYHCNCCCSKAKRMAKTTYIDETVKYEDTNS